MALWETKVYRNFRHDDDILGYRFREVVKNHMLGYGMTKDNTNLLAFFHMLDSKNDFEVGQLISLRKQIEELQIEKYKKVFEEKVRFLCKISAARPKIHKNSVLY